VEEAILIGGIDVVARDTGRERVFAVVSRPRAFGIEAIDLAVHVVVGAVGALVGAVRRALTAERWSVYGAVSSIAVVHPTVTVPAPTTITTRDCEQCSGRKADQPVTSSHRCSPLGVN